jgi:DIE2/ALG10 family
VFIPSSQHCSIIFLKDFLSIVELFNKRCEIIFHLLLHHFSGDKEHHIPVYHLAMPLHACVIYALVMAPSSLLEPAISLIPGLISSDLHGSTTQSNDTTVSQGGQNDKNSKPEDINDDVINSLQRRDMNRILSTRTLFKSKKELMIFISKHLIGLMIVTYILQHYTLSHPFLLADNRSDQVSSHSPHFIYHFFKVYRSFLVLFFVGIILFTCGLGYLANRKSGDASVKHFL